MSSRPQAEVAFLQRLHDTLSAASVEPGAADDDVAHDVADAAAQILPFVLEGEALDQAPLVGVFSLGHCGADLVPVPNSDRSVVVVERQFPALAHLVAKALAAALPTRARQTLGDVRLVAWTLDAWLTTRMLVAGGPAVVQGLGQEAFDALIGAHAERRGLYRAILEQDEALRPALALVALLESIMAQFWEQTVQALMAQEG